MSERNRRRTAPAHGAAVGNALALTAAIAAALAGAADARAADATPAVLDDIVVTARKREENLQEVPLSIDVLGAERLEQQAVTRLSDIEYSVPGLNFGAQGSGFDGARIGIRGVSSIRSFTGDQAAVAVHLDGVYLPQSGQAIGHMFDVQRVEVLKGPQGSLYGRNAVAGVINIVTKAPGDEFAGFVELAGGARDLVKVNGGVDLPLAPDHALRFSLNHVKRDGYVRNLQNGEYIGAEDYTGARLRYAGQFGARVDVNAAIQYGKDDSNEARMPGYLDRAVNGTNGIGWRQTWIDQPYDYDREDLNVSVQFDVDLGATTVRSVTGYSDYQLDLLADFTQTRIPGGAFTGAQSSEGFSQEFNWFSNGDAALDWRVGAYYMGEKVGETRFADLTTSFPSFDYDDFTLSQDGDSWAVFAAIDYAFTPAFSINVGLRYSDETKEQTQDETYGFVPPAGAAPICRNVANPNDLLFGLTPCRGVDTSKYSWTKPSGDVALNWKVADDTLLYVRVARGFRSGAVGGIIGVDNFFDRAFGGPGTFRLDELKEEILDTGELGAKSTLLDGRLILNVAAFYSEYKDQLVFTTDPITFRVIEGNVGKVEYKGADLLVDWRPSETFGVDLSANYTDSEVTELGSDVPPTSGLELGNVPIYAPKFSGALGLNLRLPVATGGLTGRLDYNYKSKTYFTPNNVHFEDAVGLLNASLRYDSGDRGWYAYVSAQNLTDEEYVLFRQFPANAAAGVGVQRPGMPRSWEIGAGWKF